MHDDLDRLGEPADLGPAYVKEHDRYQRLLKLQAQGQTISQATIDLCYFRMQDALARMTAAGVTNPLSKSSKLRRKQGAARGASTYRPSGPEPGYKSA